MTKRTLAGILLLYAFVTITAFAWLNMDAVAAAPVDVPACEVINTAGGINVYRCEPNEGATYLVNSVGFMMPEPY